MKIFYPAKKEAKKNICYTLAELQLKKIEEFLKMNLIYLKVVVI